MLKGLRPSSPDRLHTLSSLTGFPDVEGIETRGPVWECGRSSLTGFPDVEGIETGDVRLPAVVLSLTGFPDVEGIETSSWFR